MPAAAAWCSATGLHSFSRGIPKDTLSLGKGPSAYPTYPRIVISAGRAPRRYPYPPYRKPWPAWWCSLQCGHVQALVVDRWHSRSVVAKRWWQTCASSAMPIARRPACSAPARLPGGPGRGSGVGRPALARRRKKNAKTGKGSTWALASIQPIAVASSQSARGARNSGADAARQRP